MASIMTTGIHVPTSNIIAMAFTLLIAVGAPVALCIVIRQKYKAKFSSFLIGCGIFVVFVLVLEQILHILVLGLSGFGPALSGNVWLYALYGGLAAGIFEETGRYLAMKYMMKRNLNRGNALMYGVGHGGAEAILIVGFTYLNNLMYSFMLNGGTMTAALTGEQGAQLRTALEPLATTPATTFYMAGIERLLAITLHISLSLLVYYAVSNPRKIGFYFIATGLHALVDFAAVAVSGLTQNMWLVESVTLVLVAGVAAMAWKWGRELKDGGGNGR